MKNNKGQALIEFTLILPVIILLLLYIIQFGKIALQKQTLESNIELIVTLYKEKKQEDLNNYINNNNIKVEYTKKDDLTTIKIEQTTRNKMPLINKILGDKITTQRTIYDPIEQ